MNCVNCDHPTCCNYFLPVGPKKYCSLSCANSMPKSKEPKQTRICAREECDNVFTLNKGSEKKIYCSHSCSAIVSNRGQNRKKSPSHMSRPCRTCNTPLKRSAKIYCNQQCQAEYRRVQAVLAWLRTGKVPSLTGFVNPIRQYLYEVQNKTCAMTWCGITTVWHNMELRFILDHINGNPEDDRRENLRLVCPNCDSQLPTSKGKNRGNGRAYRRERYRNGQSY